MPVLFDPSPIKTLCFDVDGTLSDTDDQFVKKIVHWLQPVRFIFPDGDPRPFARNFVMRTETPGNYLFGIPDKLGIDDEIAAVVDFIYRKGLGKTNKPFLLIPGVDETLATLHSHYKMAVVSARGERSTRLFLDQFNLSHYFNCIATAQTCKHTKPYPDPILWAAEQTGVFPNECVLIGDTTVDIRAARAAGCQSVGVLCGFGQREELEKSGANLILKSTAMLQDVLLV